MHVHWWPEISINAYWGPRAASVAEAEIDFARGGRFPCPQCAHAGCPVHDTSMQTQRHLDFFQHQAFLHARKVRRAESKGRPELKRSRYLRLRNEPSISAEGRANPQALTRLHLKTARAYQIRLAFQEIYQQPSWQWGALILDRWYGWAIRSRLDPIKDAARTVMKHRDGILCWFDSHIANGLINSLVQAAKAKPRGYRSTRTLKAITYLISGKLDLKLPT